MRIPRIPVIGIGMLVGAMTLCWTHALNAAEPNALFAGEAPLTVEIRGPIQTIVRRAERSTDA
ncbi:MAG: hypothetical protein AAGD40_07460, partial [Pseudomonadota bacterium]